MDANKLLVAAVVVASAILVTVSVPQPRTSATLAVPFLLGFQSPSQSGGDTELRSLGHAEAEVDCASLKCPETYP